MPNLFANIPAPHQSYFLAYNNTTNTWAPHASVAAANADIPLEARHVGLMAMVGTSVYWYKTGVADVNLVPLVEAGGNAHLQGGNTYGQDAVIGSIDNRRLVFKVNNLEQASVDHNRQFFVGPPGQTGTLYASSINGNNGNPNPMLMAVSQHLTRLQGYGNDGSGIELVARNGYVNVVDATLYCLRGAAFGGTDVNASSIFTLNGTNKGLLIPRLTTTQRNAIASPAEGLTIFNTTTKRHSVFALGRWLDYANPVELLQTTAPVSIVNSAAELPAFDVAIPANTFSLAAYKIIKCKIFGVAFNTIGSNRNLVFKINYGGVTRWACQCTAPSGANGIAFQFDFEVHCYPSGDMVIGGSMGFSTANSQGTGIGTFVANNIIPLNSNIFTVNQTVSQNIRVSANYQEASPSLQATFHSSNLTLN